MDSEFLQYLIKLVSEISPEVWAMAKRQVVINNWLNAIYILIFLALMWFTLHTSYRWHKEDKFDDFEELATVIWFCFVVIVNIFGFIFVLQTTQYLVYGLFNPDYAALRNLLDLMPK